MGAFVRLGNAAGATGIAMVLLVAFGLQFGLNEPPCPLCTLQRVAFVLCSFGFVLNLPLPAWLLVGLLGLAGSGANLAYVTLGDQFGPAMAGRAQSSLNLILFLAAALLQSGIGWALDLLTA